MSGMRFFFGTILEPAAPSHQFEAIDIASLVIVGACGGGSLQHASNERKGMDGQQAERATEERIHVSHATSCINMQRPKSLTSPL
jgi:hypothetical protein